MGIQGLTKFISDAVPNAIKTHEIKDFFGRKVAIDASMCIYQFLVAVRNEGNVLTNEDGESTSHIMGTFYRTLRLVENGIKPVYVFEGKPPDMKGGELEKRKERREEANRELEKAQAEDNAEAIEKFSKRLVKVTPQHNEDCKKLLKLMGIPYVDAPGEAEAQCAVLAKSGKVYAVGTEDMDSLTFGSPILLRHLTFSEARKLPIKEFNLSKVLAGLDMDQDKFIDLCILLGCDYLDTIKGIGPKKAKDLLEKHKNLEDVISSLAKETKYTVPENWPYQRARELFKSPDVIDPETIELKWTDPDEEGLVEYLCGKNGFAEDRVRNGVKKLLKSKSNSSQGRIDSFFSMKPVDPSKTPLKPGAKKETPANGKKRPAGNTPARGGAKRPK